MSSDLQGYTLEAQRWQDKLLALRKTDDSESSTTGPEFTSEGATDDMESAEWIPEDDAGSAEPFTQMEYETLHRLQNEHRPPLAMILMPPPRVRSAVPSFAWDYRTTQDRAFFHQVLGSVDHLANMFGMHPKTEGRWGSITKIKPDFSEERAYQVWKDMFEPVDTNLESFQWESAPASRQGLLIDPNDPDFDYLDRQLLKASDFDVVDMLHYSSILMVGVNQSAWDDPFLSQMRDHMGKHGERLLREAVFTRNLGDKPELAQGLLSGLIGLLRHFSTQNRSGAVVSLLEIAWQTSVRHVQLVHPIMKGVVSFISTVLATSPSRRSVWMARNQENFQSTSERYFHLTVTAYFTASYYALTLRDEDSLLHYVAQLDEILAPRGDAPYTGPYYDDPSECLVHSSSATAPQMNPAASLPAGPDVFKNALVTPATNPQAHPTTGPFADSIPMEDIPTEFSYDDSQPMPTSDSTASSSDETDEAWVEGSPLSTKYVPDENFKALLRVAVHLIRAEACLIRDDHEMCRHWVDEAFNSLASISSGFVKQKLFLVDVSALKLVFSNKCQFPTGYRSVAEEFERRTILYHQETSKKENTNKMPHAPDSMATYAQTTVYTSNPTQDTVIPAAFPQPTQHQNPIL